MYEMKPEYFTGIQLIDDEHSKLFELANDAYELIRNEFTPDKYDYIVELINELKAYAAQHFRDEEAYMKSIGYKKMFSQVMEHNRFIEQINTYDLSSMDEHQNETLLELVDFLASWLVEHILEKDIEIGK